MFHFSLNLPCEVKMRKLPTLLMALTLMVTGTVLAAEPTTRPFAPVQGGFVKTAPEVPLWAKDHLLVQFTVEGMQRASLPTPGDKAVGVAARTGIASLDQVMNEIDVRGLRAAFPAVANKSMASSLGTDRWYILDLAPGADVPAQAELLEGDPNLAKALPDMIAFPATTPNDSLHADNWGHNNTAQLPAYDWGGTWEHTGPVVGTVGADANAHAAWDESQGYGSSSVVIAILDSGVDAGHPDLLQVPGYDIGDDDSDPTDYGGHGTACAGVAAGITNNLIGVSGVAGGCSIMPVKVDGVGGITFSAITAGIYYAADHGADIISMSIGAYMAEFEPTDTAITYAYNRGVTLLAATGNHNFDQISYPAYHPKVIGVGAASPDGVRKRSGNNEEVNPDVVPDPNGSTVDEERWWGSNYGGTVPDTPGAVDIIAPTILPTTDIQGPNGYDDGDYSNYFNGTSCATPYAAGVCALILSANPTFTPSQVRNQLLKTAQDVVNVESGSGWDRYSGYGFVDAAAAVSVVLPPTAQVAFSADATTGCAPLTVNFSDLSVGNIDTWEWDFGDGTISSEQNPTHEYTTADVYDVSLAVTGADGNNDTVKFGYIVVTGLPVVSFTSSSPVLYVGETVYFTDTSSGDPFDWVWDFGDGGSATVQNPSHTFSATGIYSPTLVVTNGCGPDTLTMDKMFVVGPVAGFNVSTANGIAPLLVEFTDESIGSITSWAWDFGDGVTDTAANPTHTYDVDGVYDVTLIISNTTSADTLVMVAAVTVDDVSAVGDQTPVVFGLAQNYPNPFNPSTTFRYSLDAPGHARLEVFDISGRRVANLVDGNKDAGQHEVTWRPVEMASGMYFARLTSGAKVNTRRVIMLK